MNEYEQILAESEDRPPFSNGTTGHLWMDNWCSSCRNDPPEPEDRADEWAGGCPLIVTALLGRTPAEWKTDTTHDRAMGNYTCIEYEPQEDDDDTPPPPDLDPIPGQGQLFDV